MLNDKAVIGANPETAKQQPSTRKVVASLDMGTSKVCAIVAAQDSNEEGIKILGIGITESEGMKRGVVSNIEKTVKSLEIAIKQAEQQSGLDIDEVVVGIAGDHVESLQTRGIVGISSPQKEIDKSDVQRLLDDSRKIALPSERQIIHVMPQEFVIDGQDGITDPVGMSGVRMEANVHIVTCLNTAIQNIHRCVERIGDIKVRDIVLEPIASSCAVLTDEEKEVGVALIDIGGGTTDIAIFEENIIRHTAVISIAGRQVTDDIKKGLGIIGSQAERIKREYGHAYMQSINRDDVFMIPGIGGRKPMEVSKSYLCSIIQPRMEEILEFAFAEISKAGFANGRLGAGIVLTGGTTLLKGADDLAREIFGMPVKIGIPSGISYAGLAPEVESPVYSTSVGLALYGFENACYKTIEEKPAPAKEPVISMNQSRTAPVQEKKEAVKEAPVQKQKAEKEPKQNKANNIFKKFITVLKEL